MPLSGRRTSESSRTDDAAGPRRHASGQDLRPVRYSPQHVRTTRDPVSIVSSLVIALLSFVVIFGSALFGMFVRRFLPEHHLHDDTRDTVKLGAGLIAALAPGLLVGSAKSSFDSVNAGITQAAVRVILMDRTLARYGPEAHDARE